MRPATALRSGVAGLAVLAQDDLASLWRQVRTAEAARTALREILPALVETYGLAAAALAADWYDELRDSTKVAGSFAAIPAKVDASGADALAGWGVGPLFKADADWAAARTLVAGGMQRRIANAARETVTGSSVADPGATGWQREGSGECAFCALLIGRGVVFSEASADFASHDHCNCIAVPAFGGHPRPVKEYTPGPRHGNAADYTRAREYIRSH